MILYDYRMVEGQALRYYSPFEVQDQNSSVYSYYQRADPFSDFTCDTSRDLMMPGSPYSSQSDSDGSLSSVEVSSQPIKPKNRRNEMKCCWKSCGVLFESLDQLATHVTKIHASSGVGGLFYCGWEGCSRNERGFNARYKMLVHVRTHTNEKPHKCQLCDKSFSRAENLKIHSRSHSGEKPYVCPVTGCNKAYSNSSDRFKHTRTHQVDKPYHCKVPGCTKRYTDPSSLRKHVKTYKHFTNENAIDNVSHKSSDAVFEDSNEKIQMEPTNIFSYENRYQDIVADNLCNCNLACCKTENKCSDVFRFNALINLKGEELQSVKWNSMIDPYRSSDHPDCMDIDMPLDLSLSRK